MLDSRVKEELEILLCIESESIDDSDALRCALSSSMLRDVPSIELKVSLLRRGPGFRDGTVHDDAELRSSLCFRLPPNYPREDPLFTVECPSLSNELLREVAEAVKSCTRDRPSQTGCLHEMIETARVVLFDVLRRSAAADASRDITLSAVQSERVMGRRCIYFHHMIGIEKRQCIASWSRALGINGYAKTGYPGILVIEGPECSVSEFVRRLQRLHWKHMVVRGEDREILSDPAVPLDRLRRITDHCGVVEITDASDVAERCRSVGLEELFLTSMKKYS